MKNALTKKVVIIFSILIVVVVSAVVLAFATGNTHYPQVSDPNGVFYQRLDANDNVIYSITNQELFSEIKNNDGVDQLLYLIDGHLLQNYLAALTDDEIATKLKLLTYGTTDDAVIAEFDAETLAAYEASFAQSMILAGYSGNEEAYASIVLAREAYVRYRLDTKGEVTDDEVAAEYVGSYYEDIKALKIRFTSAADATFVMRKFNLVAYTSTSLREYLGYVFTKESITYDHDSDPETDEIVADAYILADSYYYDETTQNILNLKEEIVYTLGTNSIYTDSSANEYTIDGIGNLIDDESIVVIAAERLFDTLEDAEAYFDANSQYFTMTKTDAFDQDEEAQVFDADGLLVYYVAFDGKVYNALHELIAAADLDITINKVYKTIETMGTVTVNNSRELTDAEVLGSYIDMYNYVYSEIRDVINPDATAEDLIAADNEYLSFQFTDVKAIQSSLATYMFKTLDINKEDAVPYTVTAKSYAGANDTSYYMIYKLTQPAKVDAYDIMLDYIEANIHLPAETVTNLTLPTTGWYDAKITWTTANKDYITAAGVVTLPTDAAKDIVLTYKITANGVSRTGTITVKVLVSGSTSAIDTTDPGTEPTFEEILNDAVLYEQLYQKLLDGMMTASTAETTINTNMAALRTECGFALYDTWMIIDYQQIDKTFVGVEKGSKTLVATLTSRPGYLDDAAIEVDFEVTADDLYAYAVGKNPALYLLYASQYEELLYSPFFTEAFGSQTNLQKNNSDRMAEMYVSLQDAKDYYSYLAQLYASYGLTFTYTSFSQYAYLQYGTKTELDLLKYFVKGELQPYLIAEAISEYDLVDLMVDTISDYYDNYFSLDVTHLILFLDYDENGTPDDYYAYIEALDEAGVDAYETKLAGFEAAITEYLDDEDNTFATLVTAYRAASREDATWGEFKTFGFALMTEDLNIVDKDDDTITHSLNYSGTYGVKDSYVQEYVDALVAIYQVYSQPVNADLDSMMSPLVTTIYGQHLILVQQGDDFVRFSAQFTEADPANPVYSDGAQNATGKPTLEQMQLYSLYYFYSIVYDLSDADVETTYGISVPNIPAKVKTALDFYFKDLVANMYVVGTLNIVMADRLAVGTVILSDLGITDVVFKANLLEVKNVYYDALFSDYLN